MPLKRINNLVLFKAKLYLSIFLCLFFFSACSLKPTNSGMVIRAGQFGSDPKTLNPLIASDATSANYGRMLYPGLVENDADSYEVVPTLAKKFEVSDSGKKILVELRDDIFWSDGKKITADDVIYTWNTLLRDGVATSSLKDILSVDGVFPEVQKISDREIVFKTQKVFAPFLSSLGTEIMPKHHIESFFEKCQAKTFEEKQKAFMSYLDIYTKPEDIVSSGPFLFSELVSGERIVMKKNPYFYEKDKDGNQYPYADQLIYTFSKDTGSSIFRFFADELYYISASPNTAALMKSLEKKYDYTLYEMGPSTGTNFFWFNLSRNVPEPKYSWFNNKEFRRAMSHAIDREAIIKNVFQGMAKPLYTAEPQISPFFNEHLEEYPQDIDYAKSLLQEQGFVLKNGQLYDVNSNRVEFDIYTNSGGKEREQIAVIIKANLDELGIKTNIKILEFNNFVGRLMQSKDFDAGVLALTGGNEPNSGANVWRSDGRLHLFDVKSAQENPVIRPWEKEVDKLFNKGVQTLDFNERKKVYDRFQEIIYEENPLIYIASPLTFSIAKHKVKNIRKTKYGGILPHIYEAAVVE
jgi:peptide/nickel transport system substrate-binding protein